MNKVYKNSEAFVRLIGPSKIVDSIILGFDVRYDINDKYVNEKVTIISKYRSIDDIMIVVKHDDVVFYNIDYTGSGLNHVDFFKLFINSQGEFYFSLLPVTEEKVVDEEDRNLIISKKIETYSYTVTKN